MPIDADSSVYLTGCTDKPADSRDDEIRIRFQGGAGFMPAWMFSWIVRFMQSPRAAKADDTRVRKINDDEFVFAAGPVTAHAKKFDNRLAVRVSVSLREHEGTFYRELDSATCTELEKRIADMRSALNRYDSSREMPEIAEDESHWFESFDRTSILEATAAANDAPESAA
jgi:hypothetical protein